MSLARHVSRRKDGISLSKVLICAQVNPEDIIRHLQDLSIPEQQASSGSSGGQTSHLTPFSTPYASQRDIPKYQIPQDGAPGDTVYEMLKDELDLDGRPNLNLARYVPAIHPPS